MKKLRLTLACWPYDRTRALADGSVRLEGIDLGYLPLEVEETFWRQARFQEFDASEMSLSSYVKTLNSDKPPFIAIPVFPSRSFRHSCIFVSAKSGIRKPEELKGKRVAAPEYQMTAPVWIRGILSDDFGVKVTDVQHFSGGEEEPGRVEKLKLDLPSHIKYSPIGPTQTISRMLADGELDAFVTARAPSTFYSEPDKVKRLFPDYVEREKDFFRRTKIFPIMHTVVIKREVYDANPWIAQALYKGFETAKKIALHQLSRPMCWRTCCRGWCRTSKRRSASSARTGGPMGWRRTAMCWRPSFAITMSRGCRSGSSSRRKSSPVKPSCPSRCSNGSRRA
jgi:4,5-dihydroxyphthalate decarboxylase